MANSDLSTETRKENHVTNQKMLLFGEIAPDGLAVEPYRLRLAVALPVQHTVFGTLGRSGSRPVAGPLGRR